MRSRVRSTRKKPKVFKWTLASWPAGHGGLCPRAASSAFAVLMPFSKWLKLPSEKSLFSRIFGIFSARVGCTPSGETERFRCLAAASGHRFSCGDKIFIVSGKCKLKTRTHMGWEKLHPPLLWRRDFILSKKCKLKTCTHMGWEKLHPPLLVATRFHLVEGMCKLETRTHMGWEKLHPPLLVATRFPSCRRSAS